METFFLKGDKIPSQFLDIDFIFNYNNQDVESKKVKQIFSKESSKMDKWLGNWNDSDIDFSDTVIFRLFGVMFHGTETWYDYIPLVEEDSSIKLKMEMASSVYWVAFKLITLVIQRYEMFHYMWDTTILFELIKVHVTQVDRYDADDNYTLDEAKTVMIDVRLRRLLIVIKKKDEEDKTCWAEASGNDSGNATNETETCIGLNDDYSCCKTCNGVYTRCKGNISIRSFNLLNTNSNDIYSSNESMKTERAFQKQIGIFQNSKIKKNRDRRWFREVGLGFKTPKEAIEGNYIDKKCPFTGDVSIRGRILTGVVVSTKMKRTLVLRREYLHFIPKYNRYEKRHKNLPAHVSPAFIGINHGDLVTVGQCRPLSKTVRFNVLKVKKADTNEEVKENFQSNKDICDVLPRFNFIIDVRNVDIIVLDYKKEWNICLLTKSLLVIILKTPFLVRSTAKFRQYKHELIRSVNAENAKSYKLEINGGISALDELHFDIGEQRYLSEQFLNSSQGLTVQYIVGFARYLTKTILIVSTSLELLFDLFSKKSFNSNISFTESIESNSLDESLSVFSGKKAFATMVIDFSRIRLKTEIIPCQSLINLKHVALKLFFIQCQMNF
ncbi:ribosomal protein S17-domain-containing protein [Neocallimastix lanati (nom. inval.)]|nr:ribosomal protein S17-domain-containing protein [Neocallimastix sp. JGI-2020a]